MYTLIIADDEPVVRNGMMESIRGNCPDFEIVGVAGDGRQTLEMIEQYKPDVLITDICMPFLGGLELIEMLRAQSYSTAIIVISGYEFFSYAQSAIRLGVQEYISKPFLPNQIFQALERTKETLDQQRQYFTNLHSLRCELQESLPLLQERFVLAATSRRMERAKLLERAKQSKVQLDAPYVVCVAMRIRYGQGHREEEGMDLEAFIPYTMRHMLPPQIEVYFAMREYGHFTLWFASRLHNPQETGLQVTQCLHRLAGQIRKYIAVWISCGVGSVQTDPGEMARSCVEAEEALGYAVMRNDSSVMRYADVALLSRLDAPLLPNTIRQELSMRLHAGERQAVSRTLSAMETQLSDAEVSFASAQAEVIDLCIWLRRELPTGKQQGIDLTRLLSEMLQASGMEGLVEALAKYTDSLLEAYSHAWKSRHAEIVAQAKQLIEENLSNEHFTIEDASAQLFLSPSQLRKVFRTEVGEPFWDYFIQQRMRKAEQLLTRTEMKIADIAEAIGYASQRYFAISFKKSSGMTPTEYRACAQRVSPKEGR